MGRDSGSLARNTGFGIGVFGGIVAAITGVGIDMLIYVVLVLMFRTDLRIAIPTSVVLMAFTSVVEILSNIALSKIDPITYYIDPEVFNNWLAAAPVVALGAQLGALVVSLISRTPTLVVVSFLCILQFIWTVVEEQLGIWPWQWALAAVLLCNAFFLYLYRVGGKLKE